MTAPDASTPCVEIPTPESGLAPTRAWGSPLVLERDARMAPYAGNKPEHGPIPGRTPFDIRYASVGGLAGYIITWGGGLGISTGVLPDDTATVSLFALASAANNIDMIRGDLSAAIPDKIDTPKRFFRKRFGKAGLGAGLWVEKKINTPGVRKALATLKGDIRGLGRGLNSSITFSAFRHGRLISARKDNLVRQFQEDEAARFAAEQKFKNGKLVSVRITGFTQQKSPEQVMREVRQDALHELVHAPQTVLHAGNWVIDRIAEGVRCASEDIRFAAGKAQACTRAQACTPAQEPIEHIVENAAATTPFTPGMEVPER